MNVESLERMLARGRDDALLRFSLGTAYIQAGDLTAAIVHLKAAIAHKPEYSAAWKALGKALVDSGRLHEAAQSYTQGIAAAQAHGDLQAAKEMGVFSRRTQKALAAQDADAAADSTERD
jgi:Tfp pilus assembly protein PilF